MRNEEPGWFHAPSTVEVWLARIPLAQRDLQRLSGVLSKDEAERAERMGSGRARMRFVAGRGLLRLLLAERLAAAPETLRFAYGPAGKPALAGGGRDEGERGLAFSLAHAHERVAIALAPAEGREAPLEIGVDLEWLLRRRPFDHLVERYATSRERREYAGVGPGERPRAFYRWWTRKEALVKAVGTSLARGLSRSEAPFGEGGIGTGTVGEGDAPRAFALVTEMLEGGYVVTVAVGAGTGGCCGGTAAGAAPGPPPVARLHGPEQAVSHPALPLSRILLLSVGP